MLHIISYFFLDDGTMRTGISADSSNARDTNGADINMSDLDIFLFGSKLSALRVGSLPHFSIMRESSSFFLLSPLIRKVQGSPKTR